MKTDFIEFEITGPDGPIKAKLHYTIEESGPYPANSTAAREKLQQYNLQRRLRNSESSEGETNDNNIPRYIPNGERKVALPPASYKNEAIAALEADGTIISPLLRSLIEEKESSEGEKR